MRGPEAEGVRTCAKVILAGEHAVVYGTPAVALPLPSISCDVTWTKNPDPVLEIRSPLLPVPVRLGQQHVGTSGILEAALGIALRELGRPAKGLVLHVESTIPVGCGLGSSAAVMVGLIAAIFRAHGVPLPAERLRHLAQEAEMAAHGRSSGLDVAAVMSVAPLRYVRGAQPVRVPVARPLKLMVASSGVSAATRDVVMDVAKRREAAPEAFDRLFREIGTLADQAVRMLGSGDALALGRVMDRNQALLSEVGVSCPELDALVAAAKGAGALGCKLTGAGRGGCVIALVPDAAGATVARALREAGAVSLWEAEVPPRATRDLEEVPLGV